MGIFNDDRSELPKYESGSEESDFEQENEDITGGETDLELERERNIRELHQFVFGDDSEELQKALESIQVYKEKVIEAKTSERIQRKSRSYEDKTIKFNCDIPLERRKSLRLANQPPIHYDKLEFDGGTFNDSIENLEKIIFKPKIRISSSRRSSLQRLIPVEEVTPEYLAKIAKSSTRKTYSQNGTSCHQCRQKTLDSKTICRSGKCFGVRGQFCGPCLKNRYGEDAATALLDPNWQCPCCRNRCNCSFCRKRQGKRPTGILAPIALQEGFNSVDEFLQSLNGFGDYEENSNRTTEMLKEKIRTFSLRNEKDLLGFDEECNPIFRESEDRDLLGFDSSQNFVFA